ncbi:hypothetical protein ACLOJK_034952 [Asimina triloba]
MEAVDAGSGQRAEAVASAWAATSAVGAGEAVAVAACWLVDVGVATTGGGVMLVRQQVGCAGCVVDLRSAWDEDGFVDDGRGRLASCGLCDQRRLVASTDLE